METAKAIVDIPSPWTGKIAKLHGQVGDIINTGAPLIEFTSIEGEEKESSTSVVGKLAVSSEHLVEHIKTAPNSNPINKRAKTTPALRTLARQLNVDLNTLVPSGKNGVITQHDIESAATETLHDFQALHGMRRTMAEVMTQAHQQVVPVTLWEDADIEHWSKTTDVTVRIIQAMITACQQEPSLNAWYDPEKKARKLHQDIHVGIAMDTPDGLFVPVIHNAQHKTATNLRTQLDDYKKQVNARSIISKNLQGTTITLSNFGNFVGRYATPIVVPPTVAILGVGRIRKQAVVIKEEIAIHSILPLSLSIDHRIVTGGEASRFLRSVIQQLELS